MGAGPPRARPACDGWSMGDRQPLITGSWRWRRFRKVGVWVGETSVAFSGVRAGCVVLGWGLFRHLRLGWPALPG